jgi:hypothetical protein
MKNKIVIALIITAAVIFLAAAFASSYPDGLEFVAEKLGFISSATEEPTVSSPLPDYTLPGIRSPFWSTVLAGMIGGAVVFVSAVVVGKLLRRR